MTSSPNEMTMQEFIQRLLSPERAQNIDTYSILAFSDLNDLDTVAEVGCGPGFFTVPLAKALSNGTLYALDIEEEMLEACRQRVAEARLGAVRRGLLHPVRAVPDPGIPEPTRPMANSPK